MPKAETKKCNTSIDDKGKSTSNIVRINNFNVYNYTSTTILQSQNIAVCVMASKMSQWQNQDYWESLELFPCPKI